MSPMADQGKTRPTGPQVPPGETPQGQTVTAQGEDQHAVPRMPHERDESADSQVRAEPSARRMGELARKDAERGVPDTTRGAELDATYHQLRETPPGEAPDKDVKP